MGTVRTSREILAEFASIPAMERGTLSRMVSKTGNVYYNLQCWRDGRNQCRYVPQDELEQVREAVANHARFRRLVEEYVAVIERQTREARQRPEERESKKTSRRK